jgi:Protein of unknown function (DUF3987)
MPLEPPTACRDEFEHPALETHFTKHNGFMRALALIFHLIDVAGGKDTGPVSLNATELAAAWCEFLGEHAKRIYGLGTRAAAIHAKTLARHIQQGDLPNPFAARDVYRKGWSGQQKRRMLHLTYWRACIG